MRAEPSAAASGWAVARIFGVNSPKTMTITVSKAPAAGTA